MLNTSDCESQSSAKPGDNGETRLCTFKTAYIIECSSIWAETWSVWKTLELYQNTPPIKTRRSKLTQKIKFKETRLQRHLLCLKIDL